MSPQMYKGIIKKAIKPETKEPKMLLGTNPATLFPQDKAEKIAKILNIDEQAHDNEWVYKVVKMGKYAKIETHDSKGFIGHFSA